MEEKEEEEEAKQEEQEEEKEKQEEVEEEEEEEEKEKQEDDYVEFNEEGGSNCFIFPRILHINSSFTSRPSRGISPPPLLNSPFFP